MFKYVRDSIGYCLRVCLVVCLLSQNVLSDEVGYEFAKSSAGDVIADKGISESIDAITDAMKTSDPNTAVAAYTIAKSAYADTPSELSYGLEYWVGRAKWEKDPNGALNHFEAYVNDTPPEMMNEWWLLSSYEYKSKRLLAKNKRVENADLWAKAKAKFEKTFGTMERKFVKPDNYFKILSQQLLLDDRKKLSDADVNDIVAAVQKLPVDDSNQYGRYYILVGERFMDRAWELRNAGTTADSNTCFASGIKVMSLVTVKDHLKMYPLAASIIGDAHRVLGDLNKAASSYQESIKYKWDGRPHAIAALGQIKEKQGDISGALDYYRMLEDGTTPIEIWAKSKVRVLSGD